MTSFAKLGLSPDILKVIDEQGFDQPTDIQRQAVPQLLAEDRNFIGLAQTGTGKTAAFAWPILQRIDSFSQNIQALVLAPTRELGQQIASQFDLFGKYQPYTDIMAVYGGASIAAQIRHLRQPPHILIATPGRLLDLLQRRVLKLNEVKFLVLDEADEMLNMGFREELDSILQHTPQEKMTWLFSATMSAGIRKIVKRYMQNPLEVKVNPSQEVNVNIDHQYALVSAAQKTEALIRYLDVSPDMRGVVFCRTKRETQDLADILMQRSYRADAIHGDLSQPQRNRVMNRFRGNDLQLLVATDVAARGIDVEDLTHVFHYHLPDDHAYYTHRSGRTARAGRSGVSLALIHKGERKKIRQLENQLSISFSEADIPTAQKVLEQRTEQFCLDILNTPIKGKLDPQLLDVATMLFGNLSKEELIGKLIALQIGEWQKGKAEMPAAPEPQQFSKKRKKSGGKHRHKNGRKPRGARGYNARRKKSKSY